MYDPKNPWDPMNPLNPWNQQKETDKELRRQNERTLKKSIEFIDQQKRKEGPVSTGPLGSSGLSTRQPVPTRAPSGPIQRVFRGIVITLVFAFWAWVLYWITPAFIEGLKSGLQP